MARAAQAAPLNPSPRAVTSAYKGAAAVARRLPEPVANGLARVVALAMRYLLKDRRDQVIRHQERLAGRRLTPAERNRVVRKVFSSYAEYWVDAFRLSGASTEQVDARIEVEGRENVEAALALGKGVVMAMPHIGAWDQGGAWVGHHWPLTVVAERVEPPELFEWFCAQRKANNITVVPLGADTGGALLAALARNEVLGLLCDRDIAGGGIEVEFFGEKTTLPAGPATLSLRTGAPILPVVVYQRPGSAARGVIRPPIVFERTGKFRADVTRLTQLVAAELEELIRVAPEQWHVLQPNWPSDPGYDRPVAVADGPGGPQ
jgi:phosphatidylinositol dimannoside acyltransferase